MPRPEVNVMEHDFASSNTTVGDGDNKHSVVGIQSFSIEPMTPTVSTGNAADGFSWFQKGNDRRGTIKIVVKENSPSNDKLWDLYNAHQAFNIAHSDPACPNLKANATVRMDRPPLTRNADVNDVEYTMLATYLDYRGGAYKLVQTA